MQSILDAINEWIKEILIGAINGNLSTMFGDVNEKVGTIAAEVGKTPQGWNASIFSMIQTLTIGWRVSCAYSAQPFLLLLADRCRQFRILFRLSYPADKIIVPAS